MSPKRLGLGSGSHQLPSAGGWNTYSLTWDKWICGSLGRIPFWTERPHPPLVSGRAGAPNGFQVQLASVCALSS